MKYNKIVPARFLQRPNRFIAYVELAGKMEKVHVKNTGRCRELLLPGAVVYLEKSGNPGRSTAYDLIAVEKGDRLINMDSQAPNQAVGEWLKNGGFFPGLKLVRPETVYGHSRFDFYVETEQDPGGFRGGSFSGRALGAGGEACGGAGGGETGRIPCLCALCDSDGRG